MKTRHYLLIVTFCLVFFNNLYAQRKEIPIVVIDPGHGGSDLGAIGINGAKEKDITLSIAFKILALNHKLYANQMDIYLTRYTDTLVGLGDRTYLAKQLKADVFISIHCNQASNLNAKGTEVYIHSKGESQIEESTFLGNTIQKGLTDALGIKNRGIKVGDFQVLRDGRNSAATILLELGFLSQNDEALYLSKEVSHYAVALVILQSTLKFLRL